MRKIYFITSLLLLFAGAKAQMPDGTYVPNFTATDINGNSYTLYDYLDSGYSVIIDISTTWCHPCWDYHESLILENIWDTYGPNGSQEIMVLFIEGDGETTLEDLQGTGPHTQGDWITGTPYPIIDDYNLAAFLDADYYPTLYIICPDRTVQELEQYDDINTIYNMSQDCSISTTNNDVKIYSLQKPENKVYCDNSSITPMMTIQNSGNTILTSCKINSYVDNILIQTDNWTGSLNTFDTTSITIPALQGLSNGTHIFKASISEPNNSTDENLADNELEQDFTIDTDGAIGTITINTDGYSNESSFEIVENGTNILEIDNLQNSNSTYNFYSCFQEGHCYQLVAHDEYSDGMGSGSVTINIAGVEYVNLLGTDFTNTITIDFCVDLSTGLSSQIINKIEAFPNPTTGKFIISNTKDKSIYVVNSLGQIIKKINKANENEIVDLRAYEKGTYIIKIEEKNTITNIKIIYL